MARPERIAELFPAVLADLAAAHRTPNGEPMTTRVDEEDERLDLKGRFVVDFEPGLYGPFITRRLASEWASQMVSRHGDPGRSYGWTVHPLGSVLDGVPREIGGAA